jgi:hypothetical protein
VMILAWARLEGHFICYSNISFCVGCILFGCFLISPRFVCQLDALKLLMIDVVL